MSTSIDIGTLRPTATTRPLLLKWVVALLVPIVVFTFVWSGEGIVNNVLLGLFASSSTSSSTVGLVAAAVFIIVFYAVVIALTGYLMAADTGRRGIVEVWIDILVFVLIPLVLVIEIGLIIGLALCAIVWAIYFYIRNRVRKARNYTPPPPLENLSVMNSEQKSQLLNRAIAGGFWFATTFAVIWLIADLVFFFTGSLPVLLLVWAIIRTIILPVAGYFLGRLGGIVALRRTLPSKETTNSGNVGVQNGNTGGNGEQSGQLRQRVGLRRRLEVLSASRASEEVKDFVPNDLPLRSTGARRFYITLLILFVLFYPFIDPFLFGSGTDGRLAGYGDAGYYVILALGLNIVVGFAGLLDLGYVAFFAIGAYVWGVFGSHQFTNITGIPVNIHVLPWLFWPMLIVTALVAALFGVLLGAPTLRLRGDYLAIVTLGFGEIVPIVFLELDKYTNGPNGIIGVQPPAFPGADWTTSLPYYYLILALIVLVLFANIRLRDSRLGRAWIAIREDEIAAASSGINLVNTKLLAFAAGAFFSGVAGAYHAAKLGGVSPDNFSFNDSVIYLAMVVIGGIGSIPGVIVGALVVYSINEFILAQLDTLGSNPTTLFHPIYAAITQAIPGFTFGNVRNLIFGIVLVVVMLYRPAGLLPSARRRRELKEGNDEEVQVGALDVPPGAPGFEAEVHVE